jgi:hypothetical protein
MVINKELLQNEEFLRPGSFPVPFQFSTMTTTDFTAYKNALTQHFLI